MKKHISLFIVLLMVFGITVKVNAEGTAGTTPLQPATTNERPTLFGENNRLQRDGGLQVQRQDGQNREEGRMVLEKKIRELKLKQKEDAKNNDGENGDIKGPRDGQGKEIEQQKEAFKKVLEQQREEFRKRIEQKKEELGKEIEQKKEEMKQQRDDEKTKIEGLRADLKNEKDAEKAKMGEDRITGRAKAFERFTQVESNIADFKDRINSSILKLEAKGVDTSKAKVLVIKADTALTTIKTQVTAANALLATSTNELTADSKASLVKITQDLQAQIKIAHQALNDATKALKDATKIKMDAEKAALGTATTPAVDTTPAATTNTTGTTN